MTVAGVPGSGKSTFLSEMRRDFVDLNKDQEFEILSFEFEMRMEDQLARDVSAKSGMAMKDIYSASEALDDEKYKDICSKLEEVSALPIFYVDKIGTSIDIRNTIITFVQNRKLKEDGKGLVVTIDHTLLTKGKSGDAEKQRVDELYTMLVELKKHYSYEQFPVMFIVLSQLNRDIQSSERVTNPKLHYPTQNDLFASSSAYQSSDYVVIMHRPSALSGMGMFYGPAREGFPNGLPVLCPTIEGKSMVYLHVIKERFGSPKIISCVENFAVNQITEYTF